MEQYGLIKRINDIFVADNAVILGDVRIGKNSNIWPFVCIRGDVAPIRIGNRCSIQDHVMLHCKHKVPLDIGGDVIIGHHACVHCRRVGHSALIGIGAKVLDNSEIGNNCLVAAGAVVRPGMIVPDGYMIAGVPAKIIRKVTDDDRSYHEDVVSRYIDLADAHCRGEYRSFGE